MKTKHSVKAKIEWKIWFKTGKQLPWQYQLVPGVIPTSSNSNIIFMVEGQEVVIAKLVVTSPL